MTPPDAVVTLKHRTEARRMLDGEQVVYTGSGDTIDADDVAQSLANLEAAVRREYAARVAELEESLEMACQNPADGCDCPGCSYAAEVNSTELETMKDV
jgi:N-acetylglucosamine-6-phosphate deacetylase